MRKKVDDLESIDNLRTYCDSLEGAAIDDNHVSAEYVAKRTAMNVRRYAEEIDREVADRYIELPVDMDGVPWHIGDVVDGHGVVRDMGLNRHGWSFFGMTAIDPAIHRHAKPRTLEDVLREFAQGVSGQNADFAEVVVKRYAEEIREILEVEE